MPPAGEGVPSSRKRRRWPGILIGLLSALLVVCVVVVVVASVPDPRALALSTVAAVIPAIVYTWIVLRLDRYESEPPKALAAAFGWGAVGAVVFSLLGSLVFGAFAGDAAQAVLGAPLVEESCKGIALVAMTWLYRDELDNTLDGLIYGALIGLGFAFTENILYFGNAYLEDGILGLGLLFVVRAVIGGFGHAVYTGMTGAAIGWARGRYARGFTRFVVPFLGWCLAVLLHMAWNAGALGLWGSATDETNTLVAVTTLALMVLVPGLIVLYAVARLSRRRQLAILREQLAPEVDAGTLTAAEYASLTDDRLRRATMRRARAEGGRSAAKRQRRFFDTAADLAFRKHHLARGERLTPGQQAPETAFREELAALRVGLPAPVAA